MFPVFIIILSICKLCVQVESSLTVQVGEPRGAAGGEPALVGSDVPLPEDGFTHEVRIFYLPVTEVPAFLMLFPFRFWVVINAYFFQCVH
jgi:hypothetical protein